MDYGLIDKQGGVALTSTTSGGQLSPIKMMKGPLTEQQKTKVYTNQLLLFKLEMYKNEIDFVLEQFLQKPLLDTVDCKRNFDKLIDMIQRKAKVSFCKQGDIRRQAYRKSDVNSLKQLKEFFATIYQDKHGQPFFTKEQFFEGLKRFFREQDRIFKATKDMTGQFIILVDRSTEFEDYVSKGDRQS